MRPLPRSFFARPADIVAQELLGKLLVRKLNHEKLIGKIVETEAYFGERDPASRAYGGKKTKLNAGMWGKPGTVFVYMVHNNWMFNIVTGRENDPQAVLIRALEPLEGIELMFKNRRLRNASIKDVRELTSGPGKLSQAFGIDRTLQGVDVTSLSSSVYITSGPKEKFEIARSHRIGVRADLPQKLRFYIKGNSFVSKK